MPSKKNKPAAPKKSKAKPTKPTRPGTRPRLDGKGGKPNDISWWPKFLSSLAACPDVKAACVAAGIHWDTAYVHRVKFTEFADQWNAALAQGNEKLKGVAFKWATEGFEEPVYQGGEEVGTVVRRNAQVLMFLMKSHMPEMYGDKSKIDHTVKTVLTDEEIAARGRDADESLLLTMQASVRGKK